MTADGNIKQCLGSGRSGPTRWDGEIVLSFYSLLQSPRAATYLLVRGEMLSSCAKSPINDSVRYSVAVTGRRDRCGEMISSCLLVVTEFPGGDSVRYPVAVAGVTFLCLR